MNPSSETHPFLKIAGIEKIGSCIQCGTCSGSCPLGNDMDHAPRELFALIREGAYEEVLRSNTPWYCVSCYACMVRCPKEIPVTDLMYGFKCVSREQGTAPKDHKMPDMYRAFSKIIKGNGRITESHVMGLYGMKHPLDAMKNIPLAVRMVLRKRMEVKPLKSDHPKDITRLYELTEKAEDKS